MTEKLIDSFHELFKARLEPIPGSQHARWVPWRELRTRCTPEFVLRYERQYRAFMSAYDADHLAYERRYIAVATKKYRARRKRK